MLPEKGDGSIDDICRVVQHILRSHDTLLYSSVPVLHADLVSFVAQVERVLGQVAYSEKREKKFFF